jgi:hypothetical protein
MRRLLRRVTMAGALVLFLLAYATFAWFWRWQDSAVVATIWNLSTTPHLVRAVDGTSGRVLGTVRVDPGFRTVVAHAHLDLWWRDLSAPERAAGREEGIQLEVLGEACDLLDRSISQPHVRDDGDLVFVGNEPGLTMSSGDLSVPSVPVRETADAAVPDPCDGGPARPVALVQNQLTVPVVLDGRLRVEPCSQMIVRQGDLATVLPASATAGTRAVSVPSLALQKGRWPTDVRRVTVGLVVQDDADGALSDPTLMVACRSVVGSEAARP